MGSRAGGRGQRGEGGAGGGAPQPRRSGAGGAYGVMEQLGRGRRYNRVPCGTAGAAAKVTPDVFFPVGSRALRVEGRGCKAKGRTAIWPRSRSDWPPSHYLFAPPCPQPLPYRTHSCCPLQRSQGTSSIYVPYRTVTAAPDTAYHQVVNAPLGQLAQREGGRWTAGGQGELGPAGAAVTQ